MSDRGESLDARLRALEASLDGLTAELDTVDERLAPLEAALGTESSEPAPSDESSGGASQAAVADAVAAVETDATHRDDTTDAPGDGDEADPDDDTDLLVA